MSDRPFRLSISMLNELTRVCVWCRSVLALSKNWHVRYIAAMNIPACGAKSASCAGRSRALPCQEQPMPWKVQRSGRCSH